MTTSTKDRAAAVALGVPALLEALTQFCELNSDHITSTSTVSIGLQYGWLPNVHMVSGRNAAKAVLFSLETVEDPHIRVCRHGESRQFYVQGRFEGVPMEVLACSDEDDRSADAHVDWSIADEFGFVEITPELLAQIAEHTS